MMQNKTKWLTIKNYGVLAVFLAIFIFPAHSKPVVESRTGRPVVKENGIKENDSSIGIYNDFQGHSPSPQNMHSSQNIPNTANVHNKQNIQTQNEYSSPSPQTHKPMTSSEGARFTLSQIEALQKEVIELRGLVELQEHEIKQLKKSQQDFYKDLDKRLAELNTKSLNSKSQLAQSSSSKDLNPKSNKNASSDADNLAKNDKKATLPKMNITAEKKSTPAKTVNNEVDGIKEELLEHVNAKNEIVVDQLDEETEALRTINETEFNASNTQTNNSKNNAKSDALAKKSKSSLYEPDNQNTSIAKKNKQEEAVPEAKTLGIISQKNSSNPEQTTYQTAYNLIKSKKYNEAATAFSDYLTKFPKGKEAPNAHYWLGEIYMLEWQNNKTKVDNLEKASQEFSNIVHQYPEHLRVADAILKLGLIELDKGNGEVAKLHFTDVKTRFPKSSAARVAESKLQSR